MPTPRHPRRPPRLPTVFDAYRHAPVYFVTFCTYQRKSWLAQTDIHAAFLAFIQRGWNEHRIAVGRYVIMRDHVHLLVSGGPEFDLGDWIKLLKQRLGKVIRASHRDAATPETPGCSHASMRRGAAGASAPQRSASRRDAATPCSHGSVSRGALSRVWQEGFFDHLIRRDEKLESV